MAIPSTRRFGRSRPIEIPLLWLARIFYRVRAQGETEVPRQGGAILLANHLSSVDWLLIKLASPRALRCLCGQETFERRASAALTKGELICLFPEGSLSRIGALQQLRPEVIAWAKDSGVPVIPLAHDGIWGSVFSYSWGKYLLKWPRFHRTAVAVCFGPRLTPEQLTVPGVRMALLDAGSAAFAERPFLQGNLGREIICALARKPGRIAVVDRTAARRELSAGRLMAVAAAFSIWLKGAVAARRVGIVLPPGAGATIANLAVVWAGKIPVNLNFTAGAKTVEASLRLGEVDTVITAGAMRTKLPDFPWPERSIDLRETIDSLGKSRILGWLVAAWIAPGPILAGLLGLPKKGDREEAALLFTSGSAGDPKGVVLTHRNLLANFSQISSTNVLPKAATLLGCLPIFHSFGFTITIWYALIRGMRLVTIPSPLETKKMIEAIREEAITVVVGAPTFLRPLLKKAVPADLRWLGLLVSGAEKMSLELYQAFQTTLEIELMQGYGLTETSPVTNLNQADRTYEGTGGAIRTQFGKRLGSVGKILPGMTARILEPDTWKEIPSTSTGMLLVRGENVFGGYLKDPAKTQLAFHQGWFVTGDLARFDEDGFLFIEGRLSRFSKIGGEMVPHGTIEQKLNSAFEWEARETPVAVVVSIPDASKGEALVLLTTEAITSEDVRSKLVSAGLPNLWIPRIVERLEEIPLLGTGKIDLQTCRLIAQKRIQKSDLS